MNPFVILRLFILILFFFTSCGRKKNDFLAFKEQSESLKFNKLTLPVVRELTIEQKKTHTLISWSPVTSYKKDEHFLGYNIYKFAKTQFIPKKPLNKKPIQITSYKDKTSLNQEDYVCYAMRAIFRIHEKKIEGPTSKILCIQEKQKNIKY